MKEVRMCYRGMELPVNPKTLEIRYAKKTASLPLPGGFARVQEICAQPTVLRGEGKLTGEDAQEKALRLMRIFQTEGSATLFSPLFEPMKMFFTELQLSASSDAGGIVFRFAFTEEQRKKHSRHRFGYTFARAGENLYDIANRCEVPVEELFEYNGFKDLFSVNEGDRVWLK